MQVCQWYGTLCPPSSCFNKDLSRDSKTTMGRPMISMSKKIISVDFCSIVWEDFVRTLYCDGLEFVSQHAQVLGHSVESTTEY
jgi:hypothetical protein